MQPPQPTQPQQLQFSPPSISTAASAASTQQPAGILKVSLDLPLMRADQLYPTPSMKDSLPFDVEFDLRLIGCELIQTAGRLLKLPQTAMATAQVIFHRFYYIKSFVKNAMEHHAMAAIYLSSKIEECPRRVRDVMNVFHHIKQVRTGKLIAPMPVDENYQKTKNDVIKAERRILKELGFCVHVKHPHKIIFIYLQAMECNQKNLSQKAWNYMNDALRTDVFLRFTAENIACACIYLSARELQIPLPSSPPWFLIFGADEASIRAICIRLLHMYGHQVRAQDELDKIVQKCRENIEAERQLRNKLLISTAVAQAKEAAAQHLAKQQLTKGSDSPATDMTAESRLTQLQTVGSVSSMLKSFEKTKSIQSSVLSATGLNGTSAATGPSPPNPYYLSSSHNYHHHRYHQNGHQNGSSSDLTQLENGEKTSSGSGATMKREKSSPYLTSTSHHDYNDVYDHKRHRQSDKDGGLYVKVHKEHKEHRDQVQPSYKHNKNPSRSRSTSRSRSRSRSSKKKPHKKNRSRSRSRDRSNSVEVADGDAKSASRQHKKKKSHHHHHRKY